MAGPLSTHYQAPVSGAQAAIDSGVARIAIDIAEYDRRLMQTIGELSNS